MPIVIAPTGAIGAGRPQAITLDLPTGGKRERDLRNGLTVPLRLSWRTANDFATYPAVERISRAGDSERLAGLGVKGIRISNHGVRQLDGAIASADALPDMARAVRGRVPVPIASGIRRGVDIVNALALRARTVAIGRATRGRLDPWFLKPPRATLLPHIESATAEVGTTIGLAAVQALLRWLLRARPPANSLNGAALRPRTTA